MEIHMKSITIHNVDEQLAALLQKKADEAGTSVNRAVKRLLEQALGLKPQADRGNRREFESFLGLWSKEELSRFNAATEDLEVVDDEDWR
jgi:hypothetical protein